MGIRFIEFLAKIIGCFGIFLYTILVVALLGGLAFAFVFGSIALIGISITNLFGITHIIYNVGFIIVEVGFIQLGVSLLFGCIFILIARAFWIQLQKHVKYSTKIYRHGK